MCCRKRESERTAQHQVTGLFLSCPLSFAEVSINTEAGIKPDKFTRKGSMAPHRRERRKTDKRRKIYVRKWNQTKCGE